jgi:heptaprenyl diphosphate synthase
VFLVWYLEEQEVLGIRRTVSLGAVGFLAGLGVVLHMVEGCLPPPLPLPGIKVGLANVVTLVALFFFGGREALYVVLIRIALGNLFSGTLLGVAFFLSLGGGLSSLGIMGALRQKNVSPLWTSLLGAVFHNLGQWVVAFLYVQSRALLFYLPVLLLWAVPAGFGVGYLGMLLVRNEALWRKTGDKPGASPGRFRD